MMTAEPTRRADAARNTGRILSAAHAAYAESADPSLEEIAQRAEIGIRTLYRHFGSKEELLRACLRAGLEEYLLPAIDRGLDQDDPFAAFGEILRTMSELAAGERNIIRAAHHASAVTTEIADTSLRALTTLAARAQARGTMRSDVDEHDVHAIVALVTIPLPRPERGDRVLGVILDGLSTGEHSPLPPAEGSRPSGCTPS